MYNKLLLLILFLLPTAVNSQNDVNNRFMLANSYEQAGEFEKARSILEELYQKNPDNYQVFDALNRVYIQLKKYDASAEMLNKKISANPQDVNLYGLLGKTYHLQGDEKKAFEIWDKAIEMETGNFMVYRLVANYALERRAFAKAIEVLEKGKNKAPDPAVFSYDLANLYQLTMNYTKAAEEYISLLQKAPQDIHNIRERINAYISKPEALKKTLAVFESRSLNSAEFKSLLAWLYTQDRNYEEAYKIYSELDEQRGSGGGDIFNFAQLLYSIKEYETASKVYSDIVGNYSSSPLINAAKLGYAKSVESIIEGKEYGSSGSWKPLKKSGSGKSAEIDKLIQTYLDLSKKSQNNDLSNEAAYRAARIYIFRQNNYSGGEEILKRIVNDFPVSAFAPGAALDLGYIYIKTGRLDEAENYLNMVLSLPRAQEEHKNKGKLMLGEISFYRKDLETSQKYLSQILSDLKDNSANDALELTFLLNTKMNDSLSLLKFAEAEFLKEQEKFVEAKDIYSSISEEKGGFMVGGLSKLREAEIELALDNSTRAVELLQGISDEKSRNIYSDKALYLLGNIFEYSLGDFKKAVEIYEKLLARFPGSMYLDEAREHIIKLKDKVS